MQCHHPWLVSRSRKHWDAGCLKAPAVRGTAARGQAPTAGTHSPPATTAVPRRSNPRHWVALRTLGERSCAVPLSARIHQWSGRHLNRIPTLYLREDQILSQVVAQLRDADRDDIPGLLRARRITIVCTAVSTVLDIPVTACGSSGPTGRSNRRSRTRSADRAAETRNPTRHLSQTRKALWVSSFPISTRNRVTPRQGLKRRWRPSCLTQ